MHSTDDLNDGYFGSGKRLWFSINYHGKENHVKEILEWLPTRKLLKEREKEIVNKKLINEDLCMNLCVGGEGGRGFTAEEQKLNAIKSNEKQKLLRETNPDWVKKKNENVSLANKKAYDIGKREKKHFYDWTDKKHSKESIDKMKGSKNVGISNSQYGTCWITNEKINKKIKKEEMIPDGWRLGRV